MNGCTDTCEECENDFIPVHDETLCPKCTEAKEDERAWLAHGLPKWGYHFRDVWVAGFQWGKSCDAEPIPASMPSITQQP